jgi:MFS family permease
LTSTQAGRAYNRLPPPSPWRPLSRPAFRNLLLASFASDTGTFMQSVGAAWLMVSLGAGPLTVALIQTASTLPFFVLALPAGALGDIVDRRRLILVTEYWMLAAAVALTSLTVLGAMSPWLLLALTFILSAGDALEAPSWRALLPELVDGEDLVAASALNGIEFNLARAVGPALGGLLVAAAGAGAAFAVNALSFLGVIFVVTRWKHHAPRRTAPAETVGGATVAALRYVRHSPAIRTLLLRTCCVMLFAAALMAVLPLVAQRATGNSLGYGALLASFGAGSIAGAVGLPRLRARASTEDILSVAVLGLSVALLATGWLRSLPGLVPVMLLGGAGWMIFISLLNTMVQQLAPEWVRARVLAVFLLVFQGSVAVGSFVSGVVAERAGIPSALLLASVGTAAAVLLRFWAPLPDVNVDLSAWNHWRAPAFIEGLGYGLDDGPVLITVEYRVDPERAVAFVQAAHRLGRLRRRDGASRWGIYRDTDAPDRYIETFIVSSWAEHLRQHERSVVADRAVEESTQRLARETLTVRHFLYVSKKKPEKTR